MSFDPTRALDAVFRSQGVPGIFRLSSGEEVAVRYRLTRPDERISDFASHLSLATRQVEIRNSDLMGLPRAPQNGDSLLSGDQVLQVINTPDRVDQLALVWTIDLK